jgi:sugar lactone lactonase YvrE
MAIRLSLLLPTALSLSIVSLEACSPDSATAGTPDATSDMPSEPGLPLTFVARGNTLPFTPISGSALCSPGGAAQQLVLPAGYVQTVDAIEGPGFLDQSDMNTVNETGPLKGRFLYRTHELTTGAGVSVTDLVTGSTTIVAQRSDWERFDGLVWTPWGTLLAGEEVLPSTLKDPTQPNAAGGHVYEIDPQTGTAVVRDAFGSRPHEGMRFDKDGNLYGISETGPGYIYKFVPAHRNDLSAGTLYALRIVNDQGDRTGFAEWVQLDPAAILINSVDEAAAKGATGYNRPEDVEIGTSTGDDNRGNHTLFVAVTGEDRVLAIDLKPSGGARGQVFVSDYVRDGLNAPSDFDFPDNLALDKAGNLYITEDPGGSSSTGKTIGDDVWFAPFNPSSSAHSQPIVRFLSITDCDAEPTGIYLSPTGKTLFIDVQHRGGSDPRDLSIAVQRFSNVQFLQSK